MAMKSPNHEYEVVPVGIYLHLIKMCEESDVREKEIESSVIGSWLLTLNPTAYPAWDSVNLV